MITRTSSALVAAILLLKPLSGDCADRGAVRLNTEGFNFAANLISKGRFVADKKGGWTHDHPPRSRQNDFIRDHGFADYTRWHLGVDDRHGTSSKARYKFPFGDFQNVHRCGLLAVKARAREFGDQEIEESATKLLEMIQSAGPRGQKRVD
jgi:hypothetical protein